MVMKKFRGRRLTKTAMAVRADGPRSWNKEGAGCHETPPGAQLSKRGWLGWGVVLGTCLFCRARELILRGKGGGHLPGMESSLDLTQ